MNKHSTTPADSHADQHRTELTRREFLSSVVGIVTSLFVEPGDPPELPSNLPLGVKWHLWWPDGLRDQATRDLLVYAHEWPIPEEDAREILRAAAGGEYSLDELRTKADISRVYKQLRPPANAYVK